MSIQRQSLVFVVIGGLQAAIDSTLFVLMVWLGLPVIPSNFAARAIAALLGFRLNGKFNFAPGKRLHTLHFLRFLSWWLLTTTFSSVALDVLFRSWLSLAWQIGLAKVVAEGLIVIMSFFVYRHWVYR